MAVGEGKSTAVMPRVGRLTRQASAKDSVPFLALWVRRMPDHRTRKWTKDGGRKTEEVGKIDFDQGIEQSKMGSQARGIHTRLVIATLPDILLPFLDSFDWESSELRIGVVAGAYDFVEIGRGCVDCWKDIGLRSNPTMSKVSFQIAIKS
jgi:hypothetical protein